MNKVTFLACLVCLPLLSASALELVIADDERSPYQIVIPDKTGDQSLDRFIKVSGELIQMAVRNSSGAQLPLVHEEASDPVKPGIYVGSTRKLSSIGLSLRGFVEWEHAITVMGRDIFVYGRDNGNHIKGLTYPGWFVHYMLGTMKAAVVFVERFANTRVIHGKFNSYGLHDGVRSLPQNRLAIPADYDFRKAPRFLARSSGDGIVADVAYNILRPDQSWFNHAHTHAVAVPQSEYFKSHPEYFAIIKGRRYQHHERPQYCISNPGFQKVLYDHVLKNAKSGAKIISLGQSDGFLPCECENCRLLYGVKDYGEKLWILHRNIAARLEKDCPGVKVIIMNYGATHEPPRTFREFPSNVMIEVAPCNAALLKKWEHYSPKEFNTYNYLWGAYLASGFSPSYSLRYLQKQVNMLFSPTYSKVRELYLDGGHPKNGLEGPFRYVFCKLLENPDQDIRALLHDYCRFGYGEKAAPFMEQFFLLMSDRMDQFPLPDNSDWNNFSQGFNGAVETWHDRYPNDVIRQLDQLAAKASKVWSPSASLAEAFTWEFNYLKVSATAVNAFIAFQATTNKNTLNDLLLAITQRNTFIASIPASTLVTQRCKENLFGFANLSTLKAGGTMFGDFGNPICMDPKDISITPRQVIMRPIKGFKDLARRKFVMLKPKVPHKNSLPAKFRAGYTSDALLFEFEVKVTPGKTLETYTEARPWQNDCMEFFLIPPQSDKYFQIITSPNARTIFDCTRNLSSWHQLDDTWLSQADYRATLNGGIWHGRLVIPFRTLGRQAPTADESWQLQSGHTAFLPDGTVEYYIWNISMSGKLPDPKFFGLLKLKK